MAIIFGRNGDARRDPDSGDDRTLVSEFVRRGDEAAFRSLYRRHTPPLFRLIARFLGPDRSAEDALQVTWIRAAERLHRFRWESSLRSWLMGIAINCCREIRRKERRRAMASENLEALDTSARSSVAARTPNVGLRVDLERAVASLPDGYREVLILHDVEGYTHLEIGEMLGIETGTSKSQLSRARRALRRRLAPIDAPGTATSGSVER